MLLTESGNYMTHPGPHSQVTKRGGGSGGEREKGRERERWILSLKLLWFGDNHQSFFVTVHSHYSGGLSTVDNKIISRRFFLHKDG